MSNIAIFESIDTVIRALVGKDEPFGGKVIPGLGDFRQVAPVIPNAGENDTVLASIKSSPLWQHFRTFTLTQPMRYGEDEELCQFIGDGWDRPRVTLPLFGQIGTLEEAANFLYPPEALDDAEVCMKYTFLSPRNALVDEFNGLMLERLPGENSQSKAKSPSNVLKLHLQCPSTQETRSASCAGETELSTHPVATADYLALFAHPGMPNHELHLKPAAIAVLMRNFSVKCGLVKNARVSIKT